MNPTVKKIGVAMIIPVLASSSMVSCTTVLEDTGLSTLAGAGIGAGVGSAVDKDNRGRGALIGAGVGGLAGYLISKNYQATQEQIRVAQQRAAVASRNSVTKRKLSENKTKYVAVPVKPSGSEQQSSNAKNMVMIYDAESNELVDKKAYVPSKSTYSSGEVANFGGRKTVVASGFSGI